jgi:hypothetical protein
VLGEPAANSWIVAMLIEPASNLVIQSQREAPVPLSMTTALDLFDLDRDLADLDDLDA